MTPDLLREARERVIAAQVRLTDVLLVCPLAALPRWMQQDIFAAKDELSAALTALCTLTAQEMEKEA